MHTFAKAGLSQGEDAFGGKIRPSNQHEHKPASRKGTRANHAKKGADEETKTTDRKRLEPVPDLSGLCFVSMSVTHFTDENLSHNFTAARPSCLRRWRATPRWLYAT
jgi:hypothetical protein